MQPRTAPGSSINLPPQQPPGTSRFIRATSLTSLGLRCHRCAPRITSSASLHSCPGNHQWPPLQRANLSPLPLSVPSPHAWCVHISRTRLVQKKKKSATEARLLAALRAHVAQASEPLGCDWTSEAGGGDRVTHPGSYKWSQQPPPVLSAPPRSTDSRIFSCCAR